MVLLKGQSKAILAVLAECNIPPTVKIVNVPKKTWEHLQHLIDKKEKTYR